MERLTKENKKRNQTEFFLHKKNFDRVLKDLQTISDDHFGINPDSIPGRSLNRVWEYTKLLRYIKKELS